MSQGSNSGDSKLAIAIAAAAFAIHSLGEDETPRIKKKNDSIIQLPQFNKIKKKFSNKEAKNAGETSMRKSTEQGYKTLERGYSASKPRSQSSMNPTTTADAWQKEERFVKLKSILGWANEKKMKAKHQVERKKLDLELGRAKSM